MNPSQEPALPHQSDPAAPTSDNPDETWAQDLTAYPDEWEEAGPSRRPWRRTLVVAVLSGVIVLVLGGPLGVV